MVILDEIETDHDHTVRYCHQCSFGPASGADPIILCMEVRFLGARGAPSRLADRAAQPRIAFTGPTIALFTSAFVVARTDAGPGSGLFSRLKRCHIRPHLGY